MLEWTSTVGVDLLAGVPGPQGLTALHIAAVMEDGASLAALLTGLISDLVSSLIVTVHAALFALNFVFVHVPSKREASCVTSSNPGYLAAALPAKNGVGPRDKTWGTALLSGKP